MLERFFDLPESFYDLLKRSTNAVLLESSKPDASEHESLLFYNPLTILKLTSGDNPQDFFEAAADFQNQGYYLAGYVAYETGYALLGLGDTPPLDYPLAWLGVYREPLRFDHLSGAIKGNDDLAIGTKWVLNPTIAKLQSLQLEISKAAYLAQLKRIHAYLGAGDSYQINFTSAYSFELEGSPLALYRRLKAAQRVSYGAYLNCSEFDIACLSPELFFRLEHSQITTKPMKGTIHRGKTLAEDKKLIKQLSQDEKSRAENIMIVDLLRNDLGRICQTGSIKVPKLFEVERYDSLLQMTSTVTGRLETKNKLSEIFSSLFPCGSVTGAPKRRSMEIIRELEARPRGVYTGAIGYLAPEGKAVFNVAIRTLLIRQQQGAMGVGSGIVYDSQAAAEYAECQLKARFLTESAAPFEIFETLRHKAGYHLLEKHLARLRRSAEYFNYPLDYDKLQQLLKQAEQAFDRSQAYRIKIRLFADGEIKLEHQPFYPQSPGQTLLAGLSKIRSNSQDRFLYHKTSRRHLYDRAAQKANKARLADLLFFNEREELTEGAISNVFIEREGQLLTPSLSCGLLPGVLRQELLDRAKAHEAVLYLKDLKHADAVYLGNSLRGLRCVELLFEYI